MSRHDRHSAILDIVMDEGSVHIDDIITRLGVSAATARRDLDHLADQQLVSRTRGGAIANPTSTEPPLRHRTPPTPHAPPPRPRLSASGPSAPGHTPTTAGTG